MRSSNNTHGFAHQTVYDILLKLSENPRSNPFRGILSVERDLYSSRDNMRVRTEYVSVSDVNYFVRFGDNYPVRLR